MPKRRSKVDRQSYDPRMFLSNAGSRACATKKAYETEEEAEFEADIRFISYYRCSYCRKYHLTSRGKDESKNN